MWIFGAGMSNSFQNHNKCMIQYTQRTTRKKNKKTQPKTASLQFTISVIECSYSWHCAFHNIKISFVVYIHCRHFHSFILVASFYFLNFDIAKNANIIFFFLRLFFSFIFYDCYYFMVIFFVFSATILIQTHQQQKYNRSKKTFSFNCNIQFWQTNCPANKRKIVIQRVAVCQVSVRQHISYTYKRKQHQQ